MVPMAFRVSRIAVIGAGPCGIAVAKYLVAKGCFTTIRLYEQQPESALGGVWHYTPDAPPPPPAPQTDPFHGPDKPLAPPAANGRPVYMTAMYDELHVNIVASLMRFTRDVPFPDGINVFPGRQVIQDYVVRYSQDVKHLVQFCTEVVEVRRRVDGDFDKWDLTARSTVTGRMENDTFDAVVVANGHYSVPYIPLVKGVSEFQQAHPGVITHSKQYRSPKEYHDKVVMIIGNGPSGSDIAYQIRPQSKDTFLSVRQPTPPEKLAHIGCTEVAEVVEFLPSTRSVRLKDGRTMGGLDVIMFCTGFLYSYPFLPDVAPPMIKTGKCVHGLYQHLFHMDHPTLVFPGLLMKAVPFPVAAAQGSVVSEVWANHLDLPSREDMARWADRLEGERGEALHVMPSDADGVYINDLHGWAAKSRNPGKEGPYWDDQDLFQRKIYVEAKLRFEEMGCKAKSLEDLGFHYDGNDTRVTNRSPLEPLD